MKFQNYKIWDIAKKKYILQQCYIKIKNKLQYEKLLTNRSKSKIL